MSKGQSTFRKIKKGRLKVLFNPDTEVFEHYHKASNSGMFLRGAEVLHINSIEARADKYEARAKELAELKEIEQRAAELPKITT